MSKRIKQSRAAKRLPPKKKNRRIRISERIRAAKEFVAAEKASHWLDGDHARHDLKVSERQGIDAEIAHIVVQIRTHNEVAQFVELKLRAQLRVAEAKLRLAEAEIARHASDVEYGMLSTDRKKVVW
jgi:hypothetical protein